jgi:hypothetical protein
MRKTVVAISAENIFEFMDVTFLVIRDSSLSYYAPKFSDFAWPDEVNLRQSRSGAVLTIARHARIAPQQY